MCRERPSEFWTCHFLHNANPAALIFDALPLAWWRAMKGTAGRASSFSHMSAGFCWFGTTRPSHQTAAPRRAVKGLTLMEWPHYHCSSPQESLAAAGTATCSEMGHRLKPVAGRSKQLSRCQSDAQRTSYWRGAGTLMRKRGIALKMLCSPSFMSISSKSLMSRLTQCTPRRWYSLCEIGLMKDSLIFLIDLKPDLNLFFSQDIILKHL